MTKVCLSFPRTLGCYISCKRDIPLVESRGIRVEVVHYTTPSVIVVTRLPGVLVGEIGCVGTLSRNPTHRTVLTGAREIRSQRDIRFTPLLRRAEGFSTVLCPCLFANRWSDSNKNCSLYSSGCRAPGCAWDGAGGVRGPPGGTSPARRGGCRTSAAPATGAPRAIP